MLQQILSGLTPTQLSVSAVQSIVLATALWLLRKAVGKPPPKGWFFWIASFAALYLIVTVTNAVVGGDRTPKLKGRILAVSCGDMRYTPVISPKAAPRDAGFANLIVEISNTGVPSIATDYVLVVKFGSGETKIGQQVSIPAKGFKLPRNGDAPVETYYAEDSLPRKTIQPIPKGGCVQGLLLFVIPGASRQDLLAIGTTYNLQFRDLWGTTYVAEIKNSGMEDTILGWPGIRSSTEEVEGQIMPPSPTPNTEASQPSPTSTTYP